LANYDANIKVSADTKQAESAVSRLEKTLNKLSDFTFSLNSKDIGRQVNQVGQQLRGIAERGAVGGLTLAAGKATAALSVLGSKLGVVGGLAATAGATINNALGGVPAVVTDILNQLGHVPEAFGLAAVAALAFAPQITKAAASAVGLGAAIDKAVGTTARQKIAELTGGVGALRQEIEAVNTSFADLISGSTLNELNAQLRDAVTQSGAFHSSTLDAVTAAEQLVAVQREQASEQKAINDLIRQAQGLQPKDVRDAEVARRVSALKSRELQQRRDAQLQNQINAELAEYERLSAEVAAQTKRWADNLDRIARSSRSGVLGSTSQLRTRIQQFREDRNSAEIARQRSAELLAQEIADKARLQGSSYGLNQIPVRGELLPGGNTMAAQRQYRDMLNANAFAEQALAQVGKTRIQAEAAVFRISKQLSEAKAQQITQDKRSIELARERNKVLLDQYRAEQRNPNFSLTGANPGSSLDRASRVADLRRRREIAKENAAGYENLALGVGFPLLFGGGPGSILGAAGGSFIGSGFGGQIFGGAIGQAIDQFAQSAIELGKALDTPTEAFDTLKERSLISSRELEKLGDKLQKAGFAASASALAQQDVTNQLGSDGVRNLRELAAASDEFNRSLASLTAQIQAALAGPLKGFVQNVADLASRNAQRGSGTSVRGNLSGPNQANFDRDVSRAIEQVVADRFGVRGTNSRGPTASINYLSSLDPEKLQAILDRYGPLQVGVEVKLTPEQVREQLLTTLGKQMEAIDLSRGLVQQVRERARAQEDLDLQRADLLQQQERALGDLRLSIEQRVQDIRLANLQRENELLDVQAQIRQQSLKNSNLGLRNGFTNDQVSGAANAVADYLEAELQTANDAAKIKRDAALEVQRLDIETERFKIQVATQVARLNQDSAKQVASIQRNVLRQNQDQDTRRFELEKRIAQIKLESIATELALVTRDPSAPQALRDSARATYDAVLKERDRVQSLKSPGALKFNATGLGGGGGIDTGSMDAVNARAKQLLGDITAARQALLDLVSAGNWEQLSANLENLLSKPIQKAINEAQTLWDELSSAPMGASNQALSRQGALTDLLTQLKELRAQTKDVRIQKLLDDYTSQLPQLTALDAELRVSNELSQDLRNTYIDLQNQLQAFASPYGELTNVQRVRNQLVSEGISLESSYSQELLKQAAAVDALQTQVRLATQLQSAWEGVGGAIADVMTRGIGEMVAGTATAREVFASFLNAVAQALQQTAAQMIATYIAIGIAKLFAGLGGGADAGAGDLTSGIRQYPLEGMGFTPRATGGPVASQRPYLIGENGPELFVPGTSGSVVNNRDLRSVMGNGLGAPANNAILNMSFETTNIGGVEYVSRDQLEAAMAATRRQAASDGAKRGMSMTLDKLQQSPRTRNRVGLS
jgi:hypothetical protein